MADDRRVVFSKILIFICILHDCHVSGQNLPNAGGVNNFANVNADERNINRLGVRAPNQGLVGQQGQNAVNQNGQLNAIPDSNVGDSKVQHLAGAARQIGNRIQTMRDRFSGKVRADAGTALKLAERPECRADVDNLCSKSQRNNFQVLECLQSERSMEKTVTAPCQHLIYEYKTNLTLDLRFDNAAAQVCKEDLERLTSCHAEEEGTGKRISCLIEHKENITRPGCRQFLTKMANIVFSDYRLICHFKEACSADIDKLQCGRFAETDPKALHTQGLVIECLSSKVTLLNETCKHEILRIAELQSDDFHQDRALFYACREDRERFCDKITSGNGKVYKCLFQHKFDRAMSSECRKQLTRRQQMMSVDVKVNRGLVQNCRDAIKENKCFEQDGISRVKEARQATILTCLEGVIRDGKKIAPECVAELKETRRALMEDFKISPLVVQACDKEIKDACGGGLEREGKTLHCLMDMVRSDRHGDKVTAGCKAQLGSLIDRADPGESLSMDPVLQAACGAVAQSACKGRKDDNGNVVSCLMSKIGTDDMTDECEERLIEIQYFIARDFRLDPRLYKFCHTDATALCSAPERWVGTGDTTPEMGPLVFSCLYRHYKEPQEGSNNQLSRACAFEVRRVMRQRAVSVELNPRIQEPCLSDLGFYCKEHHRKGEELKCLQEHYKDLEPDCKTAMGNFIEDTDKDVQMDKLIMRSCTPMIKRFCDDLLDDKSTEPGEVMQCLIRHKTEPDMDAKCRAGIEHHQLISLQDYRFSYKFKEACKQDVLQICASGVKTKAEVVRCLSEAVRNDTLKDATQRVSATCRAQLTFQLLQRSESVDLDPVLKEMCGRDIEDHCSNVQTGGGNVLHCLKKHQDQLQPQCKKKIFNREQVESVNAKGDFFLFKQCKRMIKTYCSEAQTGQVFKCLREHKSEHDFDQLCKKAMLERMREKAKDVRLNVNLMKACKLDIPKFCQREMEAETEEGHALEGNVMQCLRIRFAQKKLSESCSLHMSTKVKEAALDYKQDPVLARECGTQIQALCADRLVAADMDDHGQVTECLREHMLRGKITETKCLKAIARTLAESKADVHTDPILYKACSMDIKHYCQGVPRGEGRQMSCLLMELDDKHAQMTPECRRMLSDRRQMWEAAAQQAPPDTLNEVLSLMAISPSRNYLMTVLFIIVACIFVFGCCCGRVSHRIRRELKNR